MLRNKVGVSVSYLAALAALTGACSTGESRFTAPSSLAQ